MWLEAKGKANAPGPEQLRGRQNLFETFQQSSNPYIDGALILVHAKGGTHGVFHPGSAVLHEI